MCVYTPGMLAMYDLIRFFFYRDTPPRPKHLLLSTDRLMWLVETKNVQKKRGNNKVQKNARFEDFCLAKLFDRINGFYSVIV